MGYHLTAPICASDRTSKTAYPRLARCEAGLRFLTTSQGRWINRDPNDEQGFMLCTGREEPELTRLVEEVNGLLLSMGSSGVSFSTHGKAVLRALMSEDPGDAGLRNLYALVSNNPLDATDLLGLQTATAPPKECCDKSAEQRLIQDAISRLAGKFAGVGGPKAKAINALIKIANGAASSKKKCNDMGGLVAALEEFAKSTDQAGCTVFCNQVYQGTSPTSGGGAAGYYGCLALCAKAFP